MRIWNMVRSKRLPALGLSALAACAAVAATVHPFGGASAESEARTTLTALRSGSRVRIRRTGPRGVNHVPNAFRLLQFTGAPMKWGRARMGEGATVTWRLASGAERFSGARNCRHITPIADALAPSGLTQRTFLRELDAAMRMWQDVSGIRFRRAADGEAANLVLGAQARPRGRAFTNVSAGQVDRVSHRTARVDRLQDAVICLNPKQPWKVGFDGDLKVYDLRHTLAHELGHVIGLDHTGPRGAIMAFRYDEKSRGLTPGDVMGAQRLYGLPTFLRAETSDEGTQVVTSRNAARTVRIVRRTRAIHSNR